MKYLYIVDHYVPFPSSEYGGVWNVIADDDDECFDLISSEDNNNFHEQYYTNLRENIIKARIFSLSKDEKSRVVESFLT